MSRPHGRLIVNPSSPQASAECQRCGIFYNLSALQWQYEWAGDILLNTNLLFCEPCLDDPQPQLQSRVIPPDPLPVLNARPPQMTLLQAEPTQTSIATDAALGASTLLVEDVTGFSVSDYIEVQLDDGSFARVEILSRNTLTNALTISIPLPYSSSVGQLVSLPQ